MGIEFVLRYFFLSLSQNQKHQSIYKKKLLDIQDVFKMSHQFKTLKWKLFFFKVKCKQSRAVQVGKLKKIPPKCKRQWHLKTKSCCTWIKLHRCHSDLNLAVVFVCSEVGLKEVMFSVSSCSPSPESKTSLYSRRCCFFATAMTSSSCSCLSVFIYIYIHSISHCDFDYD